MKYTKKNLRELAEKIRLHKHNDFPDACTVELRKCKGKGDVLLSLKIRVDMTKIGDTPHSVFIGELGVQNLMRKVLENSAVKVDDMSVGLYPEHASIQMWIWIPK